MADDTQVEEEDDDSRSHFSDAFRRFLLKAIVGLAAFGFLWFYTVKNGPANINNPQRAAQAEKARQLHAQRRPVTDATPVAIADAPPAPPLPIAKDEPPPQANRLDQLEAKLSELAAKPAPEIPPPSIPEADKKHIEQLEKHIAQLEKELGNVKAQLGQKVTDSQKLTTLTAFGFMKEAILRGDPFDDEMKQLLPLAKDSRVQSLLAQIAPFAEDGVITLPVLQSQFANALPQALYPKQKGLSLSSNLQSLIRIRKVGEQQTGSDNESILARAEAKVGRGEIQGALKEMTALSPEAADSFAAWIKNAQVYLLSRSTVEALHMAIMKDAAPAAPAPPLPVMPPQPKTEPVPEPEPEAEPDPVPEHPPEPPTEIKTDPKAESAPDEKPAKASDSAPGND